MGVKLDDFQFKWFWVKVLITPDSSFLYDAFNKYKVIVDSGFCVKLGSGIEIEKPVFTSSQETEYFEFVFK